MKNIACIAAATVLFAAPVLGAEPHVCQQVVDAELSRVGVSSDAIASTRIERDYTYYGGDSANDRELAGYSFWIRMKACQKGYLMVTVHANCLPIGDPATVYGCKIAGVKEC